MAFLLSCMTSADLWSKDHRGEAGTRLSLGLWTGGRTTICESVPVLLSVAFPETQSLVLSTGRIFYSSNSFIRRWCDVYFIILSSNKSISLKRCVKLIWIHTPTGTGMSQKPTMKLKLINVLHVWFTATTTDPVGHIRKGFHPVCCSYALKIDVFNPKATHQTNIYSPWRVSPIASRSICNHFQIILDRAAFIRLGPAGFGAQQMRR